MSNKKVPLGYIEVTYYNAEGESQKQTRKITDYERIELKGSPLPRIFPIPELDEGEYIERNMRGDTLIFRRID